MILIIHMKLKTTFKNLLIIKKYYKIMNRTDNSIV